MNQSTFQLTAENQKIAHELINQGVTFLGVDDDGDWPGGWDVSRTVECGDWRVGIRDSETGFELCCEDHIFAYELEPSNGLLWDRDDEDLLRERYKLVSLIENAYQSGK